MCAKNKTKWFGVRPLLHFTTHTRQIHHSSIRTNLFRFSPEGRGFVIRSAGLSEVLTQVVLHSSRAHPSRTKWYAIELDFFFNVESGAVVFARTDWLSPYINVGSLHWIPNILSLQRSPRTYSVACFIATNSLPNVLVLHDVCFFESQQMGAPFRNTMKPVLERQVSVSLTWSLSTKTLIRIGDPLRASMFGGITSFTSPQTVWLQSLRGNLASSILMWFSQVEDYLGIVVLLQICKHVKECSKMTLSGQGKVRRQH